MIEIPESYTLERQIKTLAGRSVDYLLPATNEHKFTWFSGAFEMYEEMFTGKKLTDVKGHGAMVDLHFEDATLTVGDGVNIRYQADDEKMPSKYQLLLHLSEGRLVFSVAMYGGILAFTGDLDNKYYKGSLAAVPALTDAFNEAHFDKIVSAAPAKLSAKGLLATEQRIPGLGNGTLQDILFNAGIHPKRKVGGLSDGELGAIYKSLKSTLASMAEKGGRDTEKDLFGASGGYTTILSKNTAKKPCPRCGDWIVKESYMGGSVYFCPTCQPI